MMYARQPPHMKRAKLVWKKEKESKVTEKKDHLWGALRGNSMHEWAERSSKKEVGGVLLVKNIHMRKEP